MSRYYLAYGSNLNVEQMKYRCPSATIIGKGLIDGYRLMFKGSKTGSYLTIEKAKGHKVPVGVWKVSDTDEIALDKYEGYPDFYYKKEIKINYKSLKDNQIKNTNAFIYIMHEDRKLGIPTSYYLGVCIKGYIRFHFDISLLEDALDLSIKEVNKNGGK